MVRIVEHISPLACEAPKSQRGLLAKLVSCSQEELLGHLRQLVAHRWESCPAVRWHPVLNRFDDILAAHADPQKRGAAGGIEEELVCEVLRVLGEVVLQHLELRESFSSADRLGDLLGCAGLPVTLAVLRCLSACPAARQLRGTEAERRLEALARGMVWSRGLHGEQPAADFLYEVPMARGSGSDATPEVISVPAAEAPKDPEELLAGLLARHSVPEAHRPALQAQLSLWCRASSSEGRREVVAISLYALCCAVKHLGADALLRHLQRRPGLFSELCGLLQSLPQCGPEASVALLRAIGAILDSRHGQGRAEVAQLSGMLGLSVPHGVLACALQGLFSVRPAEEQIRGHSKVLVAAMDLFQVTTSWNHQASTQLGHAGLLLTMMELMQRTDLPSLTAVAITLRSLEIAAEVSEATGVVLFREFHGLEAFSGRLKREVELLLALDPPPENAEPPEGGPEAARFWRLLEEVTARRRVCRQLLKNVQTAMVSGPVQGGAVGLPQGLLAEPLKAIASEPLRVGRSIFGTTADIVSNLVQDDPSRVPQLIECGILPSLVEALSKETLRSYECLSCIPSLLASVTLHTQGEELILKGSSSPLQLVTDAFAELSFAPLLHSHPQLPQVISTHVDKVLKNRPAGSAKLTEHVVECILGTLRLFAEQGKTYPAWSPTAAEDQTEFFADRLATFGRFCWSVLGNNEQVLTMFMERKGLLLVRDLHELPCLPYHLCCIDSGQQHPYGRFFHLQTGGQSGHAAVVDILKKMLDEHHAKALAFMEQHLVGSGDPSEALGKVEEAELDVFLRALSGVSAVAEGLVAVCRDGAAAPVLESLKEPLALFGKLAPTLYVLAASQPKDADAKTAQGDTYHEMVRSVFVEKEAKEATEAKEAKDAKEPEGEQVDGGAAAPAEGSSAAGAAKGKTPPLAYAARQCFRLTARALRQMLVIMSKQLHGRARQQQATPGIVALANELASVCVGLVSQECPADPSAACRWIGDLFDLLLRMHEEQNKVAVRPLSLCAFYQAKGFPLLAPLLQHAAKHLDLEPAQSALCSGLAYFEKVTSHKRFTNAMQVGMLREADGLIPRDPLCRSVQGEALRCVMPIWRGGSFELFPKGSGPSLMKVIIHALQDVPRSSAGRPDAGSLAAAAPAATPVVPAGGDLPLPAGPPPVPAAALQALAAAAGGALPAAGPMDLAAAMEALAAAGVTGGEPGAAGAAPAAGLAPGQMVDTLVDMGFTRDQVEQGLRQLQDVGAASNTDIGNVIMWLVSHPEILEAAGAAAAPAPAGAAGAPAGDVSAAPEAAAPDSPKAKAFTAKEFQELVSDMLQDLLPRILAFGRQVPKALPVVAETLAFVVSHTVPLWKGKGDGVDQASGTENAEAVTKACLAELGEEESLVPPTDALACVTQVLASLLHRRPQVAAVLKKQGAVDLLIRLNRWSLGSIDFSVLPFARGYRTVCLGSVAPAPAGVGSPLLQPPPWLTPLYVCAHQLLGLVDLTKIRETSTVLSAEAQRSWVSGVLHVVYAFPGMDPSLALACCQLLLRLCSTTVGARAFLEYPPRLMLDASGGSSLSAPAESAGGLLLLLRWSRQSWYPGLLQMLAELSLLLLEEGPVLQQRMEGEILALFGPQGRPMSAKEIPRRLPHLFSRDPALFEEALKAVTQRPSQDTGDPSGELLLEPMPEADRPPRPKLRCSAAPSAAPQLVLQALASEACFALEVQYGCTFQKIHEAAAKKQGDEEPSTDQLRPPYPLALGPDSHLYVLDFLLRRVPGLSALLLRPPAPMAQVTPTSLPGDASTYTVVEATVPVPQKSVLLMMTRHLVPRFAGLSELWASQLELLPAAQRAPLQQLPSGSGGQGGQRCLPHLGACLCTAARHGMGDQPRRGLATEAVVALRALAAGPEAPRQKGAQSSYSAQVSAVCAIVAKLLSAADRRAEDRDPAPAQDAPSQQPAPRQQEGGTRPVSADSSVQPARRSRSKREAGAFSGAGEISALKESLAAVLCKIDLYRADAPAVATSVVKCLELLSRWEAKKGLAEGAADAPALETGDASELAADSLHGTSHGDFQASGSADGEGEEHEEDEEGDDDGEDGMDDGGGLDALVVGGGAHRDEELDDVEEDEEDDMGEGDEEEEDEGDYDDEMEDEEDEDDYVDVPGEEVDAGPHGDLEAILASLHGVLDQEGMNPDGMMFRVDIDLGEAGVIHGVPRHGRHAAVGGWSEPGDLDVPPDHPLLRREQPTQQPHHHHHHHWHLAQPHRPHHGHHPLDAGQLPHIAHAGGRQMAGGVEAGHRRGRGAQAAAAAAEGFDEAVDEMFGRIQDVVRVAPSQPLAPAEAPAASPAGGSLSPAGGAAVSPTSAQGPQSPSTPAADEAPGGSQSSPSPAASAEAPRPTSPPAATPATPERAAEAAEAAAGAPAPEASPAPPPAQQPAALAPAAEEAPAPAPAAEESSPGGGGAGAGTAEQEDPAAALDIPELARLAARLGCTQTEILRAAEIDVAVVSELPEDMRSAAVMTTVSQVDLDHLRRPASAAAEEGAGGGAAADDDAGGLDEIDPAVLEALPPELRAEVLQEEAARRRQRQEQAARRAAARATPAAAPEPAAPPGGEMDNASFIASLDPLLREEVLMTAPDEMLRTLPPELVAEAQLIRGRAFTRIAQRQEAASAAQHQQQPAARRGPVPRAPPPEAWQHPHLQGLEQQLLLQPPGHSGGGRRGWTVPLNFARHAQGGLVVQAGDGMLRQLALQQTLRIGGAGENQLIALGPGTQIASSGMAGLSAFEAADRQLLERLADFDDDAAAEVPLPLPLAVVPSICRLLYLRHEVTVPLTRLFFNLSLHPASRSCVMTHFVVLLCRKPRSGSPADALPPPHMFEDLESGRASEGSPMEVQSVGSQRVLSLLAYLLRRTPQCGEFFARSSGDPCLPEDLAGKHFVNLLLDLLNTELYLSSSQHATSLLCILHSLLVPSQKEEQPDTSADSAAASTGRPDAAAAAAGAAPAAEGGAEEAAEVGTPAGDAAAASAAPEKETDKKASAAQQSARRWAKTTSSLQAVLEQQSVLALCLFLCQAVGGQSSDEGDAFRMAGDVLVALACSQAHLDTIRVELMRSLSQLVVDIKAALASCEAATAEPSTMEVRLLRVVRTLVQVFKQAGKSGGSLEFGGSLEEAGVEDLWLSLDRTLERLDDTETSATPAQRLLSLGVASATVRAEGASGLSKATSATLASSVQAAPPKPLLNRLLPLMEAFFVFQSGVADTEELRRVNSKDFGDLPMSHVPSHEAAGTPAAARAAAAASTVFEEHVEVSRLENSRLGRFCKKHRRPVNALIKQSPGLLTGSFAPLLKHMPASLDFDNKRAHFRSQLRARRLESRHETIRLRVRRNEIFMDSYRQLCMKSGEEMRAKIQVQFQGEEGIDAGGVAKEWYGALAKEIFNPNYALFVQAGGKACTYHPNPLSGVNREHLQFFKFIGRVVGKAIHDGHNLEAWFTRGFYKHMLGRKVVPADLEAFDPEYFSNLKWMLDHDITDIVELHFAAESDELGQQKVVDLKPNGRNIKVTNDNKHEYIQLIAEHKMTNSVRQQIGSFLQGMHEIVPAEMLSLFDDKELELLISGLPDIDIEDLKANTEYHNYTPQSQQVVWLWKVLSEFTQEQRAWFLQFATGTSRVPVEGFKGLLGMRGSQKFSVHRAFGADRLPSAHTCFNQLDLPEYQSEEVLRQKLVQAISEGHEGFGFA